MFRPLLISMFLTSTALADTWTVDDDGKADFDNIQAAVDAASDGDEIIVMPGTYTVTDTNEWIPVVRILDKSISLHSSQGLGSVTISGEGVRRVFICEGTTSSGSIIDGFILSDGFVDDGAGMYCNFSSPTITNCSFVNNLAYSNGGGGIYVRESFPIISQCTIKNNSAPITGGGGIYFQGGGSATISNTLICGNSPNQIGGGNYSDGGGNTISEECACIGDINEDEIVNTSDILTLIANWGSASDIGDVNYDGIVDVSDLLIVIGNWGPCE